MPTTHTLSPSAQTLHPDFDPERPAALAIDAGDEVCFLDTLDVSWGMGQHPTTGGARPRWEPRLDGPALHGPVEVRGAKPGQVLALHLQEVLPDAWGWTWVGDGPFTKGLNASLGLEPESLTLRWTLDTDAMQGTSERGHRVDLRPFPGMIGACPAAKHSGWYPSPQGGNMDCTLLTAGSTLYLPVAVPGAMVSLGDGHGRQGDGESCGTAIECRMRRVRVGFGVFDPPPALRGPMVRRADGWAALGFGESLDDATAMALNGALDILQHLLGCSRREALALVSVGGDVRITQLVNGVRGVHAWMSNEALAGFGAAGWPWV